MKSMILATVVASAAAFAPAQQGRSSSAIAANPLADEVGAMAPVSSRNHPIWAILYGSFGL